MGVTDLNCSSIHIKPDPSSHFLEQRIYVHGQSRLLSSHGTSTAAYLSSLRSTLSGQSQNSFFFLPRSVSMYGICPVDLPGKPTRHRSLFACSTKQALPHGHSRRHLPQHSVECQQSQRLAHLCRLRSIFNSDRPQALRGRGYWCRTRQHCLRTRCNHHRSVPIRFSLGTFSLHQGRSQTAHSIGFTRSYSDVYPYIRGKMHDVNVLDLLLPEAGAFNVMDRGNVDFSRRFTRHQGSAFFVIRAKSNLQFRRLYSHLVDKSLGLRCDQTVRLIGFYAARGYPEKPRRVKYYDLKTDKTFVFLTNNFVPPAMTIADLYRCRWQVELFYKWSKQHLRIKSFYGTTDNAVKTQIWIAVSAYVPVAIIKKRLNLDASLHTILQILSATIFRKYTLGSNAYE
jgi:hypothetical protein